jgi:hypothetical protein
MTEEEARLERSREYRRRYKERQKDKDTGMQQRVDEMEKELRQAQLENAALMNHSNALSSLSSYTTSMVEALTAAASATAGKARSLGGQAIEGANTFQMWARHQWIMLPTAAELLAGTAWTPSDDQLRWFLKIPSTDQIFATNSRFLDRVTQVLEEGKRSPEAQRNAELKVDFHMNNWVSIKVIFCLGGIQ